MTTAPDTWEALHRAHTTLLRDIQHQPEFRAVSFREYDALTVLSRVGEEGMRLNQLNTQLPLSQSALSRMLDRLEHRYYVRCWTDPEDARGLRIALTDHGRQTQANITNRHHQHLTDDLLDALTPEEQDTLTGILSKLTP